MENYEFTDIVQEFQYGRRSTRMTLFIILFVHCRILAVGAASTAYFCIQRQETRDSPVVTANIDPKTRGNEAKMSRGSPDNVARVIMEPIAH